MFFCRQLLSSHTRYHAYSYVSLCPATVICFHLVHAAIIRFTMLRLLSRTYLNAETLGVKLQETGDRSVTSTAVLINHSPKPKNYYPRSRITNDKQEPGIETLKLQKKTEYCREWKSRNVSCGRMDYYHHHHQHYHHHSNHHHYRGVVTTTTTTTTTSSGGGSSSSSSSSMFDFLLNIIFRLSTDVYEILCLKRKHSSRSVSISTGRNAFGAAVGQFTAVVEWVNGRGNVD